MLGLNAEKRRFELEANKVTKAMELEELSTSIDMFIALTNVDFNENNPHYNQKAVQNTIAYLATLSLGTELSEKVEVMQMIF